MAPSDEFLNVYQLARAAAELETEWPVPADLLAYFRIPSILSDKRMLRGELVKVLSSPAPSRFFEVLRATDRLCDYFSQISCLIDAYIGDSHHHHKDAWGHTMGVLDRVRRPDLNGTPGEVMAALGMYLNKATQVSGETRIGWDSSIDDFCNFFGLRYEKAMHAVSEHSTDMHNFNNLTAEQMLDLWHVAGNSYRIGVEGFARVCQADAQGSCEDLALNPYPQREAFLDVVEAIRATDISDIWRDKEKARAARLESIEKFLMSKSSPST